MVVWLYFFSRRLLLAVSAIAVHDLKATFFLCAACGVWLRGLDRSCRNQCVRGIFTQRVRAQVAWLQMKWRRLEVLACLVGVPVRWADLSLYSAAEAAQGG